MSDGRLRRGWSALVQYRSAAVLALVVSAVLGASGYLIVDGTVENRAAAPADPGRFGPDAARGERHRGDIRWRPRPTSPQAEREPPRLQQPRPSASPPLDGRAGPAPGEAPADGETLDRAVVAGPGRPPLAPEVGGPFGSRMTTGTQQVALTFDDGPDPTYTPQILELLRAYRIQATFCVVGASVVAHPDLVRRIAAEGHTLCNHTWSHDIAFASQPAEAIKAELERTTAQIRTAAPSAKVSYYRQPGGEWSASVVAIAAQLGMSSLHWAVDPRDWSLPGAKDVAELVETETVAGAIVLLHDGGGERSDTVEALRSILPNLTRRFTLAPLPQGADPRQGRVRDRSTGQADD